MENKYYQPDITEFKVGFEYEYCMKPESSEKFVHQIADWQSLDILHDDYEHEPTELFERTYRVKYLDRFDVESCGFEIIKEGYPWQYVNNAGCKLVTDIHSDKMGMPENTKVVLYKGGDEYPYFDGTIKNVSELKQVLTMIGIKY